MSQQLIITVGREFGSGGHFIAQILAEKLNVPVYDKELLYEIALQHGYSKNIMENYDEKPVNKLASRRVRDFSNSIEENIAHRIFKFIKERADEGQSFVVVGRCAEHVLRDNKNVMKVFVRGERADKIKRVCEIYEVSERKAVDMMKKMDAKRKLYHNYYCDVKWGDTRGYDITVNSSMLGIEKTADALMGIIKLRTEAAGK